jgi:hypothetical protein
VFPVRFEPMAQDHTRLKQLWSASQTVLPCSAFTSCIGWQSDPFTAAGVDSCLHLSASDTEFQTRYNPAADLFMDTKTVLAEGGGGTPDRRNCMNAFIGILQVLIRDSGVTAGVARVQATRVSCHRFQFDALCPVQLTWTHYSFSLGSWSKNVMLLMGRKIPNR